LKAYPLKIVIIFVWTVLSIQAKGANRHLRKINIISDISLKDSESVSIMDIGCLLWITVVTL
jgi:hypothetical protein